MLCKQSAREYVFSCVNLYTRIENVFVSTDHVFDVFKAIFSSVYRRAILFQFYGLETCSADAVCFFYSPGKLRGCFTVELYSYQQLGLTDFGKIYS